MCFALLTSAPRAWVHRVMLASLLLLVAVPAAVAQSRGRSDEPTAYTEITQPPKEPETISGGMQFLSAVCWYLPNRIADIADIPRLHLSSGDGMGITVRATRFFWFSYFEDDATCLGWAGKPRQFPLFGESIHERYFGFLAAQQGEYDRDPSEVGLSAHFVVVGINLAVSLGEGLDALTGLVGVDLAGDDHGPSFANYVKPAPAPAAPNEVITTPQPQPAPELPPANTPVPPAAPGVVPAPEAAAPDAAAPEAAPPAAAPMAQE